jgi:hypothetical protein
MPSEKAQLITLVWITGCALALWFGNINGSFVSVLFAAVLLCFIIAYNDIK